MKTVLAILLLLCASQAFAYPCPSDMETNKTKRNLYSWISRFKGTHGLSGCAIEITACNPTEARSDSQVLAEVYVVDRRRREAYLPVTIAESTNTKIHTTSHPYRKALYYVKSDYFYEPELGRTETYQLDLLLDEKTTRLESLDLGTYSTNKALHGEDGNQSRWWTCGKRFEEEREEQYEREHMWDWLKDLFRRHNG